MNFFLVGNGYDLHHKFPTSYINFLHTITFLIDNKGHTFETVGSVFGNEALHQKDDFIQQCYDAHSQIYSYAVLPQAELADIVEHAENNLWFNYLQNCVAKDIHWIDFERDNMDQIASISGYDQNSSILITSFLFPVIALFSILRPSRRTPRTGIFFHSSTFSLRNLMNLELDALA